jgi:hypothetical protein
MGGWAKNDPPARKSVSKGFIMTVLQDIDRAACDYRLWRATRDSDRELGMIAERWNEDAAGQVYHIALWDDIGEPSLVACTVPEWGASPWGTGLQVVGDSDHPATWSGLDRALGDRAAWRRELAEAAAHFIED